MTEAVVKEYFKSIANTETLHASPDALIRMLACTTLGNLGENASLICMRDTGDLTWAEKERVLARIRKALAKFPTG